MWRQLTAIYLFIFFFYYRTDSSTETNALREPEDEYATVAVSVTDFQASTGAERKKSGGGGNESVAAR